MSIFLKPTDFKIKNPITGTYMGQSIFTENDTQTQLTRINAAGTSQVNAINTKGQETLASIPADYTELSDSVDNLKSDINHTYGAFFGGAFDIPIERGNIQKINGEFVYINYIKRARTKQGYLIKLNIGDRITLDNSNYRFLVSSITITGSWATTEFLAAESDSYIVLIERVDGEDLTENDITTISATINIVYKGCADLYNALANEGDEF